MFRGGSGPLRLAAAACLAVAGAPASAQDSAPPPPKRLPRAESFLGVHFDFHAGPDCKEIGKNTTRAMIDNVIDQVRPDYLQIDCKGHRGLSSYPTRVGNPAPGFVGDPLRLWREVTSARGVALYMHYSGVWDSEAILQHPDWAAVNADGKTNENATSFFAPYADRLLIPQLRELAGDYGVDGAWVDGECWASVPDWSRPALEAFHTASGLQDVPRKPSDPHWFEFMEFHRDAFRKYLRHYIAEVKKTHPQFQLCSNWAFTDHMPEPVSVPVDFISGDYSPEDSVNSARLSARYLARQGKPWDLMAWSFTQKPGKDGSNQKSAVQLQREAAIVLALGGGFQAYITQKRDGSIREERIPVMAEVAQFCRARQAVCHHAEQVPQVALLFSTPAHYRKASGLFSRELSRLRGTLQALVEGQQSVELLGEHHLADRMSQYPLILVPEWESLERGFRDALVTYVRNGGNLLLVGPRTASLFAAELGVSFEDQPTPAGRFLAHKGVWAPTRGEAQRVKLGAEAQPFGQLYPTNDLGSASQPAASITRFGQGQIAATYFTFSQGYLATHSDTARAFLNDIVRHLFPAPLVELQGSAGVDVVVNRLGGRLAINLVNTSGPHDTEPIANSIPPTGPLTLTIRQTAQPARITLEPGAQSLAFEHRDGKISVTLPTLAIHDILLVH